MYLDQINIIWAGKFRYAPGFNVEKHEHSFFQLFYIIDGIGCMVTDDNEYVLKSDEVFFCPPGYSHRFISDQTNPLRTIEVKFDIYVNDLYSDLKEISGCIAINSSEIRNLLESLVVEAINRDFISRDIINVMFLSILFKLLRQLKNEQMKNEGHFDADIEKNSDSDSSFDKIFDYIHKNLNRSIGLGELSRLAGLEASYLCRLFKKKYGTTPIRYINNLKIIKAKEIMMNSEYNITQIAETLGFCSVHYFSKCFKEKENITPLEYRNKVRNNIHIKLDEAYKNFDA